MQDLKLIKLQLRHLRTEIEVINTDLNTKVNASNLNDYYTKSEVNLYLNSIQASVNTLSTKLESISGSLVSLIDQIKY